MSSDPEYSVGGVTEPLYIAYTRWPPLLCKVTGSLNSLYSLVQKGNIGNATTVVAGVHISHSIQYIDVLVQLQCTPHKYRQI